MKKKEDTAARIARRKYEEKHKEKRDASSKVWGTSLPADLADEINEFLQKYGYTKVQLINAGYRALARKEKAKQRIK